METYGLSKEEYRRYIEDPDVTRKDISKKITTPKSVYRFRKLGQVGNDGVWHESSHWEDDVNGICMFSIPSEFKNINDPNDCKVSFNEEEIFDYMVRKVLKTEKKEIKGCFKDCFIKKLKKYKDTLQGTMRVGCFAAVDDLSANGMWDDPNFGDRGRGICIEYDVNDDNFRPGELSFLPVLYDDNIYDNTRAMKAVIDSVDNPNDEDAKRRMVCLGWGHTMIKPAKFEKEHEWRLVIPMRRDGAHSDYFNVDRKCKRDMSSAIKAVHLGPRFAELEEAGKYREAIERNCEKWNIPLC